MTRFLEQNAAQTGLDGFAGTLQDTVRRYRQKWNLRKYRRTDVTYGCLPSVYIVETRIPDNAKGMTMSLVLQLIDRARKIELERRLADTRRRNEAIAEFDTCFKSGVAAGWVPGNFRLLEQNGGFAVEESTISTSGKPMWTRVYFSRNRQDAEKALARRSKS